MSLCGALVQVLPELRAILSTAQGAQLREILRAVPHLHAAMRTDQVEDTLVPLLLRGLAQPDTRLQEEVLAAFKAPLQKVGGACVHAKVLPELMKACLRTKSGAVRAAALAILADMAPRLTEAESGGVVKALARVVSVDKSAATLQNAVKVANAIAKAKSPEYGVQLVLPLLAPLLATSSLPPHLFRDILAAVRGMLTRIEQARASSGSIAAVANGAAATASAGTVSWDDAPAVPAATSADGGVPAMGLGMASGPGEDSWASIFGAASNESAGHSASSSPSSLRSGPAAGGAVAGGAASRSHAGSATGCALPGGSAAAVQPLHRGNNGAAHTQGAASFAAYDAPAKQVPMNAAKPKLRVPVGSSAQSRQSSAGHNAAQDTLAGLSLGAASQSNGASARPMFPAPPKAGSKDPFAELCMTQGPPNLGHQNGQSASRNANAASPADNPWQDDWGPDAGSGLEWASARPQDTAKQRAKGDGGSGWNDWDPFM